MADFIIEKKSFDMQKLSLELYQYCIAHNISSEGLSKIQLAAEEYLTNILFPNFDGAAEINISKNDDSLKISFSHNGEDFMNKITDISFLSLKILRNKTVSMTSETKDGRTCAEFVLQ